MAFNILAVIYYGFHTFLRFLYSKTNDKVVKYTILNNLVWLYHFKKLFWKCKSKVKFHFCELDPF